MKWLFGKVLNYLVNHNGFRKWVEFRSSMEMHRLLGEYISYCKANDEDSSIEGFYTYVSLIKAVD